MVWVDARQYQFALMSTEKVLAVGSLGGIDLLIACELLMTGINLLILFCLLVHSTVSDIQQVYVCLSVKIFKVPKEEIPYSSGGTENSSREWKSLISLSPHLVYISIYLRTV